MFGWLQSWCGPLTVLLLLLVIQFWLQLIKWSNWAKRHRAWQERNCQCDRPGGDPEPEEPGWP